MITVSSAAAAPAGGLRAGLPSSLEPAVSQITQDLTGRIKALQNSPSPASVARHGIENAQKTLNEQLFDALASVKVLTSQVAMHLDKEWRAKLFSQLDSLHQPDEWEEGDLPVQQASFQTFLRAILAMQPERHPGLGLSHVGNLVAAWMADRDRLTIEFLPNDRVRWTISAQREDGPERYAADTPVSRLRDGLSSHKPERWFSRAKEGREPT